MKQKNRTKENTESSFPIYPAKPRVVDDVEFKHYPTPRNRLFIERFKLSRLRLIEKTGELQEFLGVARTVEKHAAKLRGELEDIQHVDEHASFDSEQKKLLANERIRAIETLRSSTDLKEYADIHVGPPRTIPLPDAEHTSKGEEGEYLTGVEGSQVAEMHGLLRKNFRSISWSKNQDRDRSVLITSTKRDALMGTANNTNVFVYYDKQTKIWEIRYANLASKSQNGEVNMIKTAESIILDTKNKAFSISQSINDEPLPNGIGRLMSYQVLISAMNPNTLKAATTAGLIKL